MTQALRGRFDAVIFDLLTAVLDSWSVWNKAAGSDEDGMRWRRAYLSATYGCGAYRPYDELVGEAALRAGLERTAAERLQASWTTLRPWAEAPGVLNALAGRGVPLGVATNCSVIMGEQPAKAVGVPFDVVVTAEAVGYYKPRPEPYREVLARLRTDPARTLFVAGSPADVPGASAVGMHVFWHNRAGLPFLADEARPFLVADTLHPLRDLL